MSALTERAASTVENRALGLAERLTDYAEHGGPGLGAAVKGVTKRAKGGSALVGALSGGAAGLKNKIGGAVSTAAGKVGGSRGGGGRANKVTNIVEEVDVGVPVRVAYNQWTQFQQFPEITKKVESVEQQEENKIGWRARIFFSHRSWESTIVEQVPDERIVWRSQGEKGHVDGAVTFHELAPNLTRVLLVLEYHPQGFFEQVGNLWRAQGRRVRLELKHFQRHVMTRTILEPDEIEGWRGEIRDSEVVRSHEDAIRDERAAAEDYEDEGYEDEEEEEEEDEEAEDEDEEDEDEAEDEEEEDEEEAEDEDDEAEDEEAEDEDEDEQEPDEPSPRARRAPRRSSRAGAGRR